MTDFFNGHFPMTPFKLEPGQETRTIMIAESDPVERGMLERIFNTPAGSTKFVFVSDGHEAMDYLNGAGKFADREHHPYPEVVILEFSLPVEGGIHVLEQIRADARHSKVAVLMWSDSEYARDFERAREAGAGAVFRRPISTTALKELLGRLLQLMI